MSNELLIKPKISDYSQEACLARIIHSYVDYRTIYDSIQAGFIPTEEEMKNININQAMKYATLGGHLDLVEYFVSEGACNWNIGMFSAAKINHIKLMDYFKSKIEGESPDDIHDFWKYAIAGACLGGHVILVGCLLDKYPYLYKHMDFYIESAAEGGHMELIDYLMNIGSNSKNVIYITIYNNWERAMAGAAKGGHMNIIQYCIDKGACNWGFSMINAAEGGHLSLIKMFEKFGEEYGTIFDWNMALFKASKNGHNHVVMYIVSKNKEKLNWNYGIQGACTKGYTDLIEYFNKKL